MMIYIVLSHRQYHRPVTVLLVFVLDVGNTKSPSPVSGTTDPITRFQRGTRARNCRDARRSDPERGLYELGGFGGPRVDIRSLASPSRCGGGGLIGHSKEDHAFGAFRKCLGLGSALGVWP